MKRIISLILVIVIITGIPILSSAKVPFFQDPDAIQLASESVLMLTCYDKDGNEAGTASGFLAFEDGIIVTNYHVVEGDVSKIVANTEDGLYFEITDVLCFDAVADIAILKTKARTRLDLLKLGSSDSLKKGSRVVAIGSPQGFLNAVSEGLYSGVYLLDTEFILFTAAISPGSSGGALFNEDGEVVGITTAAWNEAQNLNFAVPIESVISLWDSYVSGSYTVQLPSDISGGAPEMFKSQLVVDQAKLMSVDQLMKLNQYAREKSEQYQCDFVMVLTDGIGDYEDIGDFTEDYYVFNDYGYNETKDGVIFVIEFLSGDCQIYVSGAPYENGIIAGDEKFDQIFDSVFYSLDNEDLFSTVKSYIDTCVKLFEDAKFYAKVPVNKYVIGCPPDTDFSSVINHELYLAYSSGKIQDFASKYGLEDLILPIPSPTDVPDENMYLTALKSKGVLKIGVLKQEPFAYKTENGKWTGFDIDLADYLAKQMSLKLEVNEISPVSRINIINLKSNVYNLLFGGLYVKADSNFNIEYSVPYILSSSGIDLSRNVYSSIEELYKDLESQKKYTDGKKIVDDYLTDTEYYEKALNNLNSTFYKKAEKMYNSGDYDNARDLFSYLKGYRSADKYLLLIDARSTRLYYKNLMDNFYFADTKDVILEYYPIDFLEGNWKTVDGQYSMVMRYSTSSQQYVFETSLPYLYLSGATFTIDNGIYTLSNGNETKKVYKFTITNENCVKVYSYADGKTRSFFRQ